LQNIDFDPKLFAGQLIARLSDSDSPVIQALVQHARCWTKEIWIRPLSTNYKKPDSELGFSFLAAGHYLHQMLVTADGKHLVTLGQDQERGPLRIKIWDARNGRLIRQTNLKDGVMHANIAVLSDSRTIVLSTITDFTFYNLENLSIQPHFPINGDTMGPHACFLKISPDGRYGYVIEQDILRALDFKDGKRLADLLSLGARMVLDFKFSRSGRYLALILGGGKSTQEGGRQFSKQEYYQTNSNDCLYVFEVGSNHLPVCSISSLCCDSLCFTPDDESLILVSEAGRVDLVNIADRKIRTRIESLTDLQCESAFRAIGHPFGPQPGRGKVEISLDGKKAICCVGLFYFEVLDITKDAIRIACSFSSPPMLSLATVGNSLAISSNAANEMNVWELYAGKMARRLQDNAEIRGFEAVVIDGQIQVFSRNNENYIRYWDLSDIAVLKTLSENPAGFMSSPVSALHVSPSGEVVCAVRTMYIEVIDMQSRQVLTYLHEPLSPTTRPMGRPYFLPDQSRLATVSGYTIDTWLYRSSIKEKSIQLRHIGAGCSVCSSELTGDGQWLVYSDSFNRLHMIHLATRDEYEFDCGEVLPQGISVYNEDLFVLKQTPVPWGRSGVTLLPDGNSVISFSYIPHVYGSQSPDHLHGKLETTEEFVEIHDLETGRLKRRFSDPDFHWYVHRFKARHAKELVFQWVAKKQRDVYGEMSEFCVESLNVQTGSRTTIISKPTPFMDFDITQDEQKLVVATIDGVIEVISVQSGQVITHFKGDQKFTCCVVAQDEKTIIVGDDSGAVNFLYLENDQEAEIPMPNTPAPSGEIASAWSGRVFPFLGIDGLPYTESQPLAGAELTPEQSIPPSVSRESTIPTEQTRHTEKPIDNSISHATAKEVDRKPLNRKLLLLLITIILVLTSIVAYMVYDQVIVPTPAVFRTPLPQTTRVIP
jgi:WD40 repeat protein